ncbi:MAG TPA: hypothetical protein VFL41_11450 [Gaiellaceae bacterium]|nr:hypothetical protein [Gaiellaceae bacterium]
MEGELRTPKNPWWRTLLWAAGPIALAIGVIVFIVAHYSEPGGKSSKPLPALQEENAPAENVVNPKLFDAQAREVAGKFLVTAVARKNTAASWELLDPTFPGKEGYTKATWAKGDIPVIPFPAAQADARFNVTYSTPKALTVEVALVPTKGEPAVFELGLRKRGTRWLVDYWMTRYRPGVLSDPSK